MDKNDGELAAAKRLLAQIHLDHPQLKLMVVLNGWYSHAPIINLLKEHRMRYLIVARETNHQAWYDELATDSKVQTHEFTDEEGIHHQFRYWEPVALNASNPDCQVKVLEYWETTEKGKTTPYGWVTDWPVNQHDLRMKVMRAGRARWKIDNETFNHLNNHGDHLEPNFGQGKKYLIEVFAMIMRLAFLVDQIELGCGKVFRKVLDKFGEVSRFQKKFSSKLDEWDIPDWSVWYQTLIKGHVRRTLEAADTS